MNMLCQMIFPQLPPSSVSVFLGKAIWWVRLEQGNFDEFNAETVIIYELSFKEIYYTERSLLVILEYTCSNFD